MVLEYMEILNFTSRRFNRVCRDTVQKTKGPQVRYCHNLRVDLKKKKGKNIKLILSNKEAVCKFNEWINRVTCANVVSCVTAIFPI